MTDLAKVLYNVLTNDATVFGIVGQKVYPVRAPQSKSAPYITYFTLNTNPSPTKAYGNASGASELDMVYVQVNCIHESYHEMNELVEAVRDAFDRIGEVTYYGVTVQNTDMVNYQDFYDDEVNLFIGHCEFTIRVKKTPVSIRLIALDGTWLLSNNGLYLRAVA